MLRTPRDVDIVEYPTVGKHGVSIPSPLSCLLISQEVLHQSPAKNNFVDISTKTISIARDSSSIWMRSGKTT